LARSGSEGPVGNPRPALPLQIRRQRKEDVRGHGRRRAGDGGGRRIHRGQLEPQPPYRRLVDPRIGRGQDGNRSEEICPQAIPASTGSAESLRRGRQQPRERLVSEPDVDDHGPGLALVRLPGRRVQERKSVMGKNEEERRGDEATRRRGEKATANMGRREMVKLAAGAIIAPALPQAKPRAKRRNANPQAASPRFSAPEEFSMVDELSELIVPADEHSPGARAAKVAEYIDQRLAESFGDEPKLQWREGLKLVDQISV